jgi:hypothetical protein
MEPEKQPEKVLSEHAVIRTDLRTILTILGGVLVLASLVWTNRYHIEQMEHTALTLSQDVQRLEDQIHRLEVELAKRGIERDADRKADRAK